MKRTQVLLTEKQYRLVKELSLQNNKSMAQVIRDCITRYSADSDFMTDEEKYQRALKAAGRLGSGIGDLSIDHDKYLGKDYGK